MEKFLTVADSISHEGKTYVLQLIYKHDARYTTHLGTPGNLYYQLAKLEFNYKSAGPLPWANKAEVLFGCNDGFSTGLRMEPLERIQDDILEARLSAAVLKELLPLSQRLLEKAVAEMKRIEQTLSLIT